MANKKRKPTTKERAKLTDAEMEELLEADIRNSTNAAARVAAIRMLREMRNEDDGQPKDAEGFDSLDEVSQRRNFKTKAA